MELQDWAWIKDKADKAKMVIKRKDKICFIFIKRFGFVKTKFANPKEVSWFIIDRD